MAPRGNQKLFCSLCAGFPKDPWVTPCGHSFCCSCIRRHWDGEDEEGAFSCPECKQVFTPWPGLVENTMLADYVEALKTVVAPQLETRADFLKHSCELTVDPNSKYTWSAIFNGDRERSVRSQIFSYLDNPVGFFSRTQALSRESLPGRCYWEVKWTGSEASVAVSYPATCKSRMFGFGLDENSWALHYYNNKWNFLHLNVSTPVCGPQTSRVGVYLDHSSGFLSFIDTMTMTPFHSVMTTFTQPLYAGLVFENSRRAEFCKLEGKDAAKEL